MLSGKNKLLNEKQYRFHEKRSTKHAVIDITEYGQKKYFCGILYF
jgi:hypothetical protein